MQSSEMLRRVALVRIDVSEEPGTSFIRVTKIGALGTTQAATSNRRTLLRSIRRLLVAEDTILQHYSYFADSYLNRGDTFPRNVGSYKSLGVTSNKTEFFIITAVATSNLTWH
jgi:hypothetical protein